MKKDLVKVLKILKSKYPQKADMDLGNPADSLIATIMSARTTDAQVLKIFPAFRKKFPTWKKLADSNVDDIAKAMNTIGLYRNKAKSLKALAQKIIAYHDGKVPESMEELVTLPGVGRKTASCVLSVCFNKPAIAVDTHVFRISRRLGWAKGKDALKVEKELADLVPKSSWSVINLTFVPFGRDICKPGKPQCYRCPIAKYCDYPNKYLEP
ncbi:MAG: endonuclease III [Patescibacteria group bacterium]|nr:endonuclease III [Patescibacteria group bacterium]